MSDITASEVTDIAKIMEIDIDPTKAMEFIKVLETNDLDTLEVWVDRPGNLEALQSLVSTPNSKTVLVNCDACNELSTHKTRDLSEKNPIVACPHCDKAVNLGADQH
jgi:hypothetical protein